MMLMKKITVVLISLVIMIGALGCQKQHPIKVQMAPAMKAGTIITIAIFPFTSAVHQTDDPDNIASKTFEKFFFEQLDLRQDYKFVTPSTVSYAAEQQGLTEREERFLASWPKTREPDLEFFSKLAEIVKCDAFLIGTVDLWQKDEIDFQENASPSTYVGATISILDVATGEVLFHATDEDYLEGMRSETSDRQLVTGGSGNVYKDMGERVFKAPPFEDVTLKVAKALVRSLPRR
jgi:hypothetical protein